MLPTCNTIKELNTDITCIDSCSRVPLIIVDRVQPNQLMSDQTRILLGPFTVSCFPLEG